MTDVDRLFAVPLEDFVAERKQAAKELRAAGDREAAAEVAKLPKPTPPAWALNQLAREEPDIIGAWLDVAEELRDVSADPGAGLREAMAAHRDATRTLLGMVRDRARPGGKPLSEPMLERVRDLLQAATVDAGVADALRRGVVVEGAEAPTFAAADEDGEDAGRGSSRAAAPGGSSAGAGARRSSAAAERREAKEREAERRAKERADRLAELERHIQSAEEELARLRDDSAERDAAVAAADERLEEARRTLHRSESEASAAHAAADEARTAVATVERELRQLTRQLRSASS